MYTTEIKYRIAHILGDRDFLIINGPQDNLILYVKTPFLTHQERSELRKNGVCVIKRCDGPQFRNVLKQYGIIV